MPSFRSLPSPHAEPRAAIRRHRVRRIALAAAVGAAAMALVACASTTSKPLPPLQLAPKVDIARFMGDWYVIALIPTFLEKDTVGQKESYRLDPDGSIDTTFTYRKGSFEGERRELESRAFVQNDAGNTWGVQFIWPIKADYRISHVDDDYSATVVTREKRDHVWIMSRNKTMPEAELQRLIDFAVKQGYDAAKIVRVPQR